MENIAAIDLYKGFVPVDKGLGFSNLIGKVDLSVEKPHKEQTTTFSQMLGSNDAKKALSVLMQVRKGTGLHLIPYPILKVTNGKAKAIWNVKTAR